MSLEDAAVVDKQVDGEKEQRVASSNGQAVQGADANIDDVRLKYESLMLEKLKAHYDAAKFLLGSVAVALVGFFGKQAIVERETTIKEVESQHAVALKDRESNQAEMIKSREIERLEIEQLGKYIDYALSDNVATRERFARYFSRVSRSPETKAAWASYLEDVVKEREKLENEVSNLKTLEKQLEIVSAKEKSKSAELAAVKAKLRAAEKELTVNRVVIVGHSLGGASAALGVAATGVGVATGIGKLSVNPLTSSGEIGK